MHCRDGLRVLIIMSVDAFNSSNSDAAMGSQAPAAPRLTLTDFLDLSTLQDIQDSFTVVTHLATSIRDATGEPLTAPTNTAQRAASDALLEQLISTDTDEDGNFIAPIIVEGQQLGSIVIEPRQVGIDGSDRLDTALRTLADKLGLSREQTDQLVEVAEQSYGANRASGIQFLYLLANSIARLCYEEYHARQRVEELSALYTMSTLLSGQRDLNHILNSAAKSIAEVMKVKAVSIRLLDEDSSELHIRAVHGLSERYQRKGPVRLDESSLLARSMTGNVQYVEDMSSDDRVLYPEDAQLEGLASMLVAGIIYQGRPIGTMQLLTGELRRFTRFEMSLVQAIAQMLASAIENARLDMERLENQRMIRQLALASDVQRRMLPSRMPNVRGLDIAAKYVPSFELGGDFYDFVRLDDNLGIAIGDVVGKGIAASLLMASVRASLRAYAQDVYDLDEIIARVNSAMTRDTLDSEFATLWYGVIDPDTLRLTYCSAGHEPPILLREGKLHYLDRGGMVVGIDSAQEYEKGLWDLQKDDLILLYTDGLPDAMNQKQERFGHQRIEAALRESCDRSAADTLNHLLWVMRRYTGIRRSTDDATLVVVKVLDEPEVDPTA